MTAKVIQGSFQNGQPKLPPVMPPPIQTKRLPVSAFAAHPPGPPPPAFAARPPGLPAPAFAVRPGAVQRHAGGGAFAVEARALGLASSGGRALPDSLRGKMEAALGADFANVRVHVGPQAERIGAIAFTLGSDIYFAPGRYQPETVAGQQLLGHELAHVVQQRAGRVRNPLGSGIAVVHDHTLEAEADRLGQRAAAYRLGIQAKTAPVAAAAPAAGLRISPPISAGPGRYRLTAGAGGRPVGSVVVHAGGNGAVEVTDLRVSEAERGRGIGRMLLASAAKTGRQFGGSRVTLAAQDSGSGRLTRWYKEMGFAQTGVNRRGCPQLEAPIGRLLAGAAAQPKAPRRGSAPPVAGSLSLRPTAVRSESGQPNSALNRPVGGLPKASGFSARPAALQPMEERGKYDYEGSAGPSLPGSPRRQEMKKPSLKALATPRTFQLPDKYTADQDILANELNKIIEENNWQQWQFFALPLIEILDIENKTVKLWRMARHDLFDREDEDNVAAQWRSLNTNHYVMGFDLLRGKQELRRKLVGIVWTTMDKAGQIAYLKNLDLDLSEWAIIVEVHFYYNRPADAITFHRDTIGDTLFVNLNYLNDKKILGPEYIMNPNYDQETELEEIHTAYIKENLPERVWRHIIKARKAIGRPRKIAATKIKRKGVVSFVDELIYHATPVVGRRTVPSEAAAKIAEASKLPKETWESWRSSPRRLNMDEAIAAGIDEEQAQELFATHQTKGVSSGGQREKASIPSGKEKSGMGRVALAPALDRTLKRQMSKWAIKGKLPAPVPQGAKRQFFRTWVRIAKRSQLGEKWKRTEPGEKGI